MIRLVTTLINLMKINQLLSLVLILSGSLLFSSCKTLNGPFSSGSAGGWDTINDASLYRSQDSVFRR